MKSLMYSIIFQLFALPVLFGQSIIEKTVNDFVKHPGFEHASISIQAVNCETGAVIASYNDNLSLPPASTMKLVSTASALELFGPEHKLSTRLYYTGEIKDSVLIGDIWIRGGGDISLGSSYFENDQDAFLLDWVNAIKKSGIKSITGNVIGDGSFFDYSGAPDGWTWGDMGNYYGAGPAGLSIYDNTLQYFFKTRGPGSTAAINYTFPTVEDLIFSSEISGQNVRGDNSYIYGGPYSTVRFGTGSLPINQNEFKVKGSLPDPEYQAALELFKTLNQNAITINGKPQGFRKNKLTPLNYDAEQLIIEHAGKNLSEIITLTNHKSINVFAETMLAICGTKSNSIGGTKMGIKEVEKYWQGKMGMDGLYISDGSGLSRNNAISANHFCQLLRHMYGSTNYEAFLASLPISGVSGTLKSVCRNQKAHGKVYAKSGTMNRIKSYAGYVKSSSGSTIAFAVIVNNQTISNGQTVDQIEKLLNVLSDQ